MKVSRDLRERLDAIKKFPAVKVERVEYSKHIKLYLTTPQGPKLLSISRTPSDWRAWKNNETLLRQWSQA